LEEVEKWLLNYVRNANRRTPVESAITMIKLNAPRRRQSMTLTKPLRSQKKEEYLSAPREGGPVAGWQFVAEHVIQVFGPDLLLGLIPLSRDAG
jgi:hypothetical protein